MRSPFHFPRRLQRDLLLRAVLLWVGARAFVTIAGMLGLPPIHPLAVGMSVGTILLVGITLLIDVRVCREVLLLGNLGVSRAQILVVAVGVSAVAETAVHVFAALA